MDAFGVLVMRYRRPALRVAYTLVGDEAEDVVQDAMVKAYRKLGGFRPGGPFRAWLMRIVVNESSNRRRAAGRRAGLVLRVVHDRPSAHVGPSPEDAAVAREQRETLATAIAQLPERDRTVIALKWFAQMSEAEMATALGCAAGTVKSRVSRALDRLRSSLPESVDR